MTPSSRGLGHRPFTAVTGVRIPVGSPLKPPKGGFFYGEILRGREPRSGSVAEGDDVERIETLLNEEKDEHVYVSNPKCGCR